LATSLCARVMRTTGGAVLVCVPYFVFRQLGPGPEFPVTGYGLRRRCVGNQQAGSAADSNSELPERDNAKQHSSSAGVEPGGSVKPNQAQSTRWLCHPQTSACKVL